MKKRAELRKVRQCSLLCCEKQTTGSPVRGIYTSNEPKSVLVQDLGDCRDNLRNSQSMFLIVVRETH